jgi:uroporphyrinogen III methyltransferase/synthase
MNTAGNTAGTVYLIGAGPGDPGLLTLRGAECLARADVVVYDSLANPDLLRYARPDAERVYAGKQGGGPQTDQETINALIVERARAGKAVARLKGGDPFIFGRGGEEAEALAAAGIPFEIVPGVTSAIAAPAYAGIPLTHREYASSVAFVTGHEDPGKETSGIDWERLATGVATLVFLMGVRTLPDIVDRLVAHGRPADTPVAVIRWGTKPEQETVVGTLADIAERVRARGIKPPALTVVGEVVRLRERLNWFEEKPLFGRRVVITRAREQASEFACALRELGAEPIEFPTIEIRPPDSWAELDAVLDRLPAYDWMVFTSVNGVRFFVERLRARGRDVRAIGPARICAIGPATAAAIEGLGLRVDVVPGEYRAEAVVEALDGAVGAEGLRGRRVLLPRAAEARDVLPKELARRGATVDVVPAYRTVMPAERADEVRALLAEGRVDAIAFTSSSTVRNFVEMVGRDAAPGLLARATVAAIGPITAETATRFGLRVDLVPEAYTIPALTEALLARLTGSPPARNRSTAAAPEGGEAGSESIASQLTTRGAGG